MNPKLNFENKLQSWNRLRQTCFSLPLEQCLQQINQWWFQLPWTAYYLHWDDLPKWPDPWQLLEDNLYCSLARGLGIVYTIAMIDRADLQTACLMEVGGDNLVLIEGEKYILNWDKDQIVNINLTPTKSRRRLDQQQLKQQIK